MSCRQCRRRDIAEPRIIGGKARTGQAPLHFSVGRLRPPHFAWGWRARVIALHASGAWVPVSMHFVEHDVGWIFNPGFDHDLERHLRDDRVGGQRNVVPTVKSPHDFLLPETRRRGAPSKADVTLSDLVPPMNPSSVGKATNVVVLHSGIVQPEAPAATYAWSHPGRCHDERRLRNH